MGTVRGERSALRRGRNARTPWSVAAWGLAALLAAGCGDASTAFVERTWVELGPGDTAIARAITSSADCPALEVDGEERAMSVRAPAAPPAFAVTACEAEIPAGARQASIGGLDLPLPRPEPRRIAVVGDTGCRLETGHPPQQCNDPAAWPFAALAETVAATQPDLIIHVGDYLYREDDACPPGDEGCAGSPYGYNWPTIEADFFAPAEPLLRAAPLVLTRGNHESCNRAGEVWFRFLAPEPWDGRCAEISDTYAIELGDLQLLMLDSNAASDTSAPPPLVAAYRVQFDALRALAGPRAMVVTHRPIWAFGHQGVMDGMEVLFQDNPTLQAASENSLPATVEAVLSGHIHLFEMLSFAAPRPPQFVIGDGGTALDPAITTPLAGLEIAGAVVDAAATFDGFGWALMERDGSGWSVSLRDVAGAEVYGCVVADGQASCS